MLTTLCHVKKLDLLLTDTTTYPTFFTVLLNKVCINVQNEPHLLPVTNETF